MFIVGRQTAQPSAQLNPQTMAFCDKLGIDDPIALLLEAEGTVVCRDTIGNPVNAIHPLNKIPTSEVNGLWLFRICEGFVTEETENIFTD